MMKSIVSRPATQHTSPRGCTGSKPLKSLTNTSRIAWSRVWLESLWSACNGRIQPPGNPRRPQALIASLNEQGADYLLIGGYALFAHGYHRATTDIDVLVPATQEAGIKIRSALMVLPDQAAKDIDPAWFDEGENIRVADAFVVDIMLNASGETYETLKQYAETIDLDGVPVHTINLEGLLLTKQTMREKDVSDRIILERALETLRELASKPESDHELGL